STLLQQNGFDGRIEEKLEQNLGRKLNKDKINLGRLVFFDKGLGLHQDNSCAGCHSPGNGFGDSQPMAIGVDNNDTVGPHRDGPRNQRRAPSAINTAFFPKLMWNGRFSSNSGNPFDNSKGFLFPPPEDNLFKNGSAYAARTKHLLVAQAHIPFTELPEMAGFTSEEEEGKVAFSRFSGLTIANNDNKAASPMIFSSSRNKDVSKNTAVCTDPDFGIFNDGHGFPVPPIDPAINSANFRIRDKVLELINDNREYRKLFGDIYPSVKNGAPVDFIMVGEVVAEFEFYLTAAKAPIDKYAMGNKNALSDAEKRGAILFFTKGKCVSCHAVNGNSNQMFSDFISHNAGVPQIHPVFGVGTGNVPFSELACPNKTVTGTLDYGLEEFTGNSNDRYKFRSSPLRNLKVQTAFFHNGSFRELKDALDFHLNPSVKIATYNPYDFGVPHDLKYKSSDMANVMITLDPVLKQGISLSGNEKNDLLVFLTESLYDRRASPENLRKEIPKKVPSGIKLQYFEFGDNNSNKPITEKNSAVESESALKYTLYPNPVTDQLVIENNHASGIAKVEIINGSGISEIVQIENSVQKLITIPMQKLRPGIYFIRITNKDSTVITKKIMKK
ncbi:MAG TPA: cytochrome c peroxidase, partial [Chitinophagaceae bacterium]